MTTRKISAGTARPVTKTPAKKVHVKNPELAEKQAVDTGKKTRKEHKKKVVRDSFTMPQEEYSKIAEVKAVCLKAKMHVKKSEVLRAGLKLLVGLDAAQLKRVLGSLEKIKTGRPQKH